MNDNKIRIRQGNVVLRVAPEEVDHYRKLGFVVGNCPPADDIGSLKSEIERLKKENEELRCENETLRQEAEKRSRKRADG